MCFVKLAVTRYETGRPVPAIGADDIWINRHHIVALEEHLGTDAFTPGPDQPATAVSYYPCLQLLMSNGQNYLVPVGIYRNPETGMDALRRFLPLLVGDVKHAEQHDCCQPVPHE